MRLRQRRVGAREVGIVIREFAMLVSPWDARSPQRSLGPGSQLAVAARHSPVVYTLDARNGFPTCTFTQRTNVSGSLNHCDSSSSSHDRVCLAPDALARFLLFRLCTGTRSPCKRESLTICVHPVQDRHVLWRTSENRSCRSRKALPMPEPGRRRCETGFRRGFSQLTFL